MFVYSDYRGDNSIALKLKGKIGVDVYFREGIYVKTESNLNPLQQCGTAAIYACFAGLIYMYVTQIGSQHEYKPPSWQLGLLWWRRNLSPINFMLRVGHRLMRDVDLLSLIVRTSPCYQLYSALPRVVLQ